MRLIPFFGEGHLLWASDYPHPDSVWPNSRDAIERQMRHRPPDLRRKLTHDNAAALYGLEERRRIGRRAAVDLPHAGAIEAGRPRHDRGDRLAEPLKDA
jgi:hypothetical protein